MKLVKPVDKQNYHWHHIIPRGLGGSDDASNLVLLSPLDHALAHIKRYEDYGWPGDLYAAKVLMGSLGEDGFPVNTKGLNAGENNPMYGIRGPLHPSFGKPGANKGKKIHSEEHIAKLKHRMRTANPQKGHKRFDGDSNPAKRPEVRAKMRKPKSISGQREVGCIKCHSIVTTQTISHHFGSKVCLDKEVA